MSLKKIYNSDYVLARGASGSILFFTLSEALGPIDLTGWTVTLTIEALSGTDPGFALAACTVDPDQTTNKGKGSFTFDAITSDLIPGEYRIKFRGVDLSGDIRYFPTGIGSDNYGRLIVVPNT